MSVDWMKILGRMLFGWGFVVVGAAYYWFATFVQSDHVIPVVFGYFGVAMTSAALIGWSLYEGRQVERLRAAEEIAAGFRGHTSQSTYWMEQSQMAMRLLDAERRKNKALTDRLRRVQASECPSVASGNLQGLNEHQATMVAWAPSALAIPVQLTAVSVPVGKLTQEEWWRALSARVSLLAIRAGTEKVRWAASILGEDISGTNDASEAGQIFVESQSLFAVYMQCVFIDNNPFPVDVTGNDPDVEQVLKSVDFDGWVSLARTLTADGQE
jgi:hypothetical protein